MREEICTYKGEKYSVRDNGEILRHPRDGKKPRPKDNQWTFGKPNQNGYMHFNSEVIHRIVAYAFLGEPPSKQHIVDHLDTNRQNNRPENLRWLTKLENIINNPITVKKIIICCGSIEAFLKDPSILKKYEKEDQNFGWMRNVSPEEAQISLDRLLEWAKSDKIPTGGTLGDWIFKRNTKQLKSNTSAENEIHNIEEIINNVFAKVEKETRVNRNEILSKSRKHGHDNARIYAAKLLSQLGLSNQTIGKLIGRSSYLVSTYFLQSRHFTLRE
ncbi:MAG: HNH endonuclease signature motif containing protein [Chitinophagales bacterium]